MKFSPSLQPQQMYGTTYAVEDGMKFSPSLQPQQTYGITEFAVPWGRLRFFLLQQPRLTKVFGKGDVTDPRYHQQPGAQRVPADGHTDSLYLGCCRPGFQSGLPKQNTFPSLWSITAGETPNKWHFPLHLPLILPLSLLLDAPGIAPPHLPRAILMFLSIKVKRSTSCIK